MKTTRRDFLKQAGTIGVCTCCFGATSLLSSCSASKNTAATVTTVETADMVSLPESTFSDKNSSSVKTKKFEEPIFISKQQDGSYIAVLMHCTHRGCALKEGEGKLVCPCHGSEFTTAGAVTKGPAKEPLQTFKVSVEDKNVVIHFN